MPPVRIKVYGLVSLTKKSYLRIQSFGLVILLSIMAAGGAMMKLKNEWRPIFPPKDVHSALILFFWVSLATVLLEVVETSLVLRKFAAAEQKQQTEASAVPPDPVADFTPVNPEAVQLPSGVQPARPVDNNSQP
jgi:hypothetical protein